MNPADRHAWPLLLAVLCGLAVQDASICNTSVCAAPPNPRLKTVLPAGARAGRQVELTLTGEGLEGQTGLHLSVPHARVRQLDNDPLRFAVEVPADTPAGLYDLWAVGDNGVTAPRPFLISQRAQQQEAEPNESASAAQTVSSSVAIHGRIGKGGDQDHFRFAVRRGQRVTIECWAERIDSRLRPVLELFGPDGDRLAVNRGYFGVDPLIHFRAEADGQYVVRVHDLVFAGSDEHYYRLDVGTHARAVFAVPSVVQRGTASRITVYGWNLTGDADRYSAGNADVGDADADGYGAVNGRCRCGWSRPRPQSTASLCTHPVSRHLC